ncbi:hypothetical protein LCGC14_1814910, partial [marine sediment metagenome]
VRDPGTLTWNSGATGGHEAGGTWDVYDLTAYLGALEVGTNVLAVHGLNMGAGSSDFLVLPRITAVTTEYVYAYDDAIETDVVAQMKDVNSSAYLRLPFTVAEGASYDSLALRMKYDDGFVANLNGTGTGDRLNQDYFLQEDVTVFDDGVADRLTGSSGQNWLIEPMNASSLRRLAQQQARALRQEARDAARQLRQQARDAIKAGTTEAQELREQGRGADQDTQEELREQGRQAMDDARAEMQQLQQQAREAMEEARAAGNELIAQTTAGNAPSLMPQSAQPAKPGNGPKATQAPAPPDGGDAPAQDDTGPGKSGQSKGNKGQGKK